MKTQIITIFTFIFLTLIIGFIYSANLESSCDYHPPLDKEQSLFFKFNFKLNNGHPISKNSYWYQLLFLGLGIGLLTNYLIKKRATTQG